MKLMIWLVSLWLMPLAWADDVVVCDPSDALVPNRVVAYERSTDPAKTGAANNANAMIWSLPASSVRPWDGIAPPVASRYWTCVDTNADGMLDDVVSMRPGEIDAVEAPALAAATVQQGYTDEVTGNTLCTATLTEIDSRIDALINPVSTLAEAKTALKVALKRMARCVRARAR